MQKVLINVKLSLPSTTSAKELNFCHKLEFSDHLNGVNLWKNRTKIAWFEFQMATALGCNYGVNRFKNDSFCFVFFPKNDSFVFGNEPLWTIKKMKNIYFENDRVFKQSFF